jgi:N-methylhydantoinase A
VPFSKNYLSVFHSTHQRRYGFCDRKRGAEAVTIRVTCTGKNDHPAMEPERLGGSKDARSAVTGKRRIFSGTTFNECAVYDRDKLEPGMTFSGPTVVHEYSATTYVPPDWHAEVDGYRNIILTQR